MALKVTLNKESDFTGEYEPTAKTGGLWRINESAPDTWATTCALTSTYL